MVFSSIFLRLVWRRLGGGFVLALQEAQRGMNKLCNNEKVKQLSAKVDDDDDDKEKPALGWQYGYKCIHLHINKYTYRYAWTFFSLKS